MNDLRANIKLIIAIIVIFLLVLGIFFIREKLSSNFSDAEEQQIQLSVDELPDYSDSVLYNYANSSSNDLHTYLNNLSNNHKLLIGGINDSVSFSTIRNNLIDKFGTDLGVRDEDYYMLDDDSEPLYILKNGIYTYNEDAPETDYITELGEYFLYNYKVKNIKNENGLIAVTYYGLYYQENMGEENTYYNKNKKILNKEDKENYSYYEFESSIDNYFNTNKNDFLEFKYYLEPKDNSYVLKEFEILNK